jgi:hypothetical protein
MPTAHCFQIKSRFEHSYFFVLTCSVDVGRGEHGNNTRVHERKKWMDLRLIDARGGGMAVHSTTRAAIEWTCKLCMFSTSTMKTMSARSLCLNPLFFHQHL